MMGGGNKASSSESDDSSLSSRSDESLESDSCGTTTTGEDDSATSSNSSSSSVHESAENVVEYGAGPDGVDDGSHHTCDGSNGHGSEEQHSVYASRVQDWTEKVPIGMNLCPWAKLSHKDSRIRYVTCHEGVQTPEEASEVVWKEIRKLEKPSLPAWSTTLVICPHVNVWKKDYAAFETFVKDFGTTKESLEEVLPNRDQKNEVISPTQGFGGGAAITLVPFHPQFLRWRGLPETISTGSRVRCHRGLAGFSKSPTAHPAIVVDLFPKGFGRRRIRVRFDDAAKSTEQCIPLDWVVLSKGEERPPLSDNLMHRAPYPVIHILRNEDLRDLSIHEISRLKRRNAKRMVSETLF